MFNAEEAQFIVTSIDTLVRQTGLQHAAMGLAVVQKLQRGLQNHQAEPSEKTESPE